MSSHLLRRLVGAATAVVVTTGLLALASAPAQAAAPSNDSFAAATALVTGGSGTTQVYGTTVDATTEPGEPSHDPDGVTPTFSSIWYTYTPTANGNLYVAVHGAVDYDPAISVYTGSTVAGLTRVAGNDDARPGQGWSQVLWMPVTAGTTYRIAVAGKEGGQSWTQLTYGFRTRPALDDPGNAAALEENWSATTWNVHATAEPGESEIAPLQTPSRTVWWRYTPDHNGTFSVNTAGSGIDTVLAVFRQDTTTFGFAGLTRLGFNDDANPGTSTSAIGNLSLKAGRVYWIAVDGYAGAEGQVTLTNTWVQSTRPDNDDLADAFMMHDGSDFYGSTATATLEAGEPQHLSTGSTGKSVWYQFTPSSDGAVTVDLSSSTFDTVAALYRGTTMANLVKVAEDRGWAQTPKRWTLLRRVPVQAGQHYYLAVAGAGGDSGTLSGVLRLGATPTVTSLGPGGGPLAGGNWVVVRGTNLAGSATEVTFGQVPATQVTGLDEEDPSTVVRAQVPAGLPAGPVAVTVASSGGVAAQHPTYVVGEPTVAGLSTGYVRLSGGQVVSVAGTGFSGTPVVTVGGVPVAGVTVQSPTSLSFVAPPRVAEGTVAVTVSTPAGTADAGSLTYLARPAVTKLSRKAGPRRGGYRLTVSGRSLVAVGQVLVGARPARFSLVGGKLVVTVPKGRTGRTVAVRVVTPGGTSAAVPVARFHYR